MPAVGVVGATGAVGVEMVQVLHARGHPAPRLFASRGDRTQSSPSERRASIVVGVLPERVRGV